MYRLFHSNFHSRILPVELPRQRADAVSSYCQAASNEQKLRETQRTGHEHSHVIGGHSHVIDGERGWRAGAGRPLPRRCHIQDLTGGGGDRAIRPVPIGLTRYEVRLRPPRPSGVPYALCDVYGYCEHWGFYCDVIAQQNTGPVGS